MSSPDFRSDWFASAVSSHSNVTGTAALADGLVRVTRKADERVRKGRSLPPITVAPLGNFRIDSDLVDAVLTEVSATAIVLVPKAGHYDWAARELAEAGGSTILTVKELYTFMGEEDSRPFQDKNVVYSRQRLEQHSNVVECQMICEASLRLRRKHQLSDVTVAVEYQYEFSEEAAVRAIKRHPDADILLNANPNGRATTAAYSHARSAQVAIYGISDLMGALHTMTKINSAATNLLMAVEEHVSEVVGIEIYLFGSSSTPGQAAASDIDVLLVYPDGDLPVGHDLAEAIRELPAGEIYDVLALSKSEEHELQFIDSERAMRIWPPSP